MLQIYKEKFFLLILIYHYTNSQVIITITQKAIENYYFIKKEINKLIGRINQEGLTLVPTKMYFKKGKVKIEIAVAKRKKTL